MKMRQKKIGVCTEAMQEAAEIRGKKRRGIPTHENQKKAVKEKMQKRWLITSPQGITQEIVNLHQFAKEHNFSWLLMMDQDSLPDGTMVGELIKAYRAGSGDTQNVALIGTNFTYRTSGNLAYEKECDSKGFFERTGIQISGSLLSLDAYEATGPFREDFFVGW